MGCELSIEPRQLSVADYKLIMDNTYDLVCIYRLDNLKCIYINQAFIRTTDYEIEDLNSRTIWDLIHPDSLSDLLSAHRNACAGKDSIINLQCRRKNGVYIWLEIRTKVIIDETGPIIMYIARNVNFRPLQGVNGQEHTDLIGLQVDGCEQDISRYRQRDDLNEPDMLFRKQDKLNYRCWLNYAGNNLDPSVQRLEESKSYYYTLVATVPIIITQLNIQGEFIWANEQAEQFFGCNMCGTYFGKYFVNIWDAAKFDIQSFFREKREMVKVETSVIRKDGNIRVLQWHCKVLKEYGKVIGVLATAFDITEMRESEARLKAGENNYRNLFKKSPVGLLRCDVKGNIIDINDYFLELLGTQISPKINIFEIPGTILKNAVLNLSDVIHKGKTVSGEVQFVTSWGKSVWFEYQAAPVVDEYDKITEIMVASKEISARKEIEEKIRFYSFHDALTGVYNRAYFNQEIERLDVKRQLPLSIIIGDVNGLKLVNDAFGHGMGDNLLITIAGIIKNLCRKEDIVARWGGDEFAVLLPQTRQEVAFKICNRIRQACQCVAASPIQPSIALGVAAKEEEETNMSTVIQEAEARMYRNKLLESERIRSVVVASLEQELQQRTFESREHVERLQRMCADFGKVLKLSLHQQEKLALLARLHDIGKVGIPEEILRKAGPLSLSEWEIIKRHSEIGYRIIRNSMDFVQIAEEILAHHEKWDGTGYPKGSCSTQIPFLSRILAIVDAYDIMTHECVYKKTASPSKALDEIRNCAGSQFDPDLAEKFITMMSRKCSNGDGS